MNTIYGIKNCDSVKKARKLLEENGVKYEFHDFRVDGITKTLLAGWLKSVPYRLLLNKRSTTWKQLEKSVQLIIDTRASNQEIIDLFIAHPTLIKRPVLVNDNNEITVGFSEEDYLAHCKKPIESSTITALSLGNENDQTV